MTPRTKILALGGLAVLLLYGADVTYRHWFDEPARELQSQLDRLDTQLREADDASATARKASRSMSEFAARSLPYDPELARSLYQDWLLQLVELHHLEAASVDAGTPDRVEVKSRTGQKKRRLLAHRFGMTLRAKTTLPQLISLLAEFRHAGHLHKIRTISLVPLGTGAELDVNLTIDVLSLQGADRKDSLSEWVRDGDDGDPQIVYADLLRRNLFARGLPQALAHIRLQAITVDKQGRMEAWLAAGSPASTQILARGESLDLAVHQVTVEEIQSDKVRLNINQSQHWIAIGQYLRDVLEPAESVVASQPLRSNSAIGATPAKDTEKQP